MSKIGIREHRKLNARIILQADYFLSPTYEQWLFDEYLEMGRYYTITVLYDYSSFLMLWFFFNRIYLFIVVCLFGDFYFNKSLRSRYEEEEDSQLNLRFLRSQSGEY